LERNFFNTNLMDNLDCVTEPVKRLVQLIERCEDFGKALSIMYSTNVTAVFRNVSWSEASNLVTEIHHKLNI
jgi:hypothetical protein